MGTTAQKLQALANSKAAIKAAIEAKGVSDVGNVFSTYATKISQIPSGGGSKYGMTLDGMIGDVDSNGVLQGPSGVSTFESNEITSTTGQWLSNRFYKSSGLQRLSLPNITSVQSYGIWHICEGCTSLTTVDLSGVITINGQYAADSAFRDCTSLTTVDFTNLTSASGTRVFYYAFCNCTSLTTVSFPNLSTIGAQESFANAFRDCTSLTTVYLSKLSIINNTRGLDYAFYGCTALELVDFSNATAVPALSNVNAFQNTNNTFKIVVPDALYDQWIVASNWSTYASHIVKASEYTPAS